MLTETQRIDHIAEELYRNLRRLAERAMSGERPGHTLQPTAVVHEAFLRMANSGSLDLDDKQRFLAMAGKIMRQVLVDHARTRRRIKRGCNPVRVELSPELATQSVPCIEVLALHAAMERLEILDPRQAQIVELRYWAGFEVREVAEILGLSITTVKREASMARAWLTRELSP